LNKESSCYSGRFKTSIEGNIYLFHMPVAEGFEETFESQALFRKKNAKKRKKVLKKPLRAG